VENYRRIRNYRFVLRPPREKLFPFDVVATDVFHLCFFRTHMQRLAAPARWTLHMMFAPSGHFSYNWVHPDRPKFASNNRMAGSQEENQAAVHGNLSAFGTYTIGPDGALSLQIVGSSYPNWNGTTQNRTVEISGDQMKFTSPSTSVGGRSVLMLTRAQ
jgi:hypothetical protein